MADFPKHLARQLKFLQNSAELFDKGDRDEAYRIAVTVRVLLHDTNGSSSRSLLKHLNAKDTPLATSTGPVTAETISYDGMSISQFTAAGEIKSPKLDEQPIERFIGADNWWNETVIVQDGSPWSRKRIVLAVANKDGGAHVDATLPSGYEQMQRGMWRTVDGDGAEVAEAHLVALRQMAHELLNSPALGELAQAQV